MLETWVLEYAGVLIHGEVLKRGQLAHHVDDLVPRMDLVMEQRECPNIKSSPTSSESDDSTTPQGQPGSNSAKASPVRRSVKEGSHLGSG